MTTFALTVNGRIRELSSASRLSLADALRENCGLTGTHLGCEHGVCGACTVQCNGQPVRSCLMLAVQADGEALTMFHRRLSGRTEHDGRPVVVHQFF